MKKLLLLALFIIPVICSAQEKTKERKHIDPVYGDSKESLFQKNNAPLNSGFYLERAGKRYLTGVGLSVGGAAVSVLSVNEGYYGLATAGVAISIAGVITTIFGHTDILKAGKLLKQEKITFSPASEGVGLAINF